MKRTNVFPVIHHLNSGISLGQVEVAKRCGADGVFLISHYGKDDEVVSVAADAKKAYPDFLIGINLLTRLPLDAAYLARDNGLDMVWADDMGVDSKGCTQEAKTLSSFVVENPGILMFASVAFKYRLPESNPAAAAVNALNAGFFPTTSGSATGHAPDVDKIISMSNATEGILAIASGMTPENVGQYAPYLSHILVSTGISLSECRIDEEKLKKLIAVVRGSRPKNYAEGLPVETRKEIRRMWSEFKTWTPPGSMQLGDTRFADFLVMQALEFGYGLAKANTLEEFYSFVNGPTFEDLFINYRTMVIHEEDGGPLSLDDLIPRHEIDYLVDAVGGGLNDEIKRIRG